MKLVELETVTNGCNWSWLGKDVHGMINSVLFYKLFQEYSRGYIRILNSALVLRMVDRYEAK